MMKNISHSDENQKYLAQQGAIKVLIDNAKRGDLTGTPREAQVLIKKKKIKNKIKKQNEK